MSEIDKINSQIHILRAQIRELKEKKEKILRDKHQKEFEEKYCLSFDHPHLDNDEYIRTDVYSTLNGEYPQSIRKCSVCQKEWPFPIPIG